MLRSDRNEPTPMTFFTVIGVLTLFVLTIALRGIALAQLWNWFVVPLGAASIHAAWAFGLSITIMLFFPRKGDKDELKKSEVWVTAIFHPLTSLLLGWCLHRWLM